MATHDRRYRSVTLTSRRYWLRLKYWYFAPGAFEHREPTFGSYWALRRNLDQSGKHCGPFEYRRYRRHCGHVTAGPFTLSIGRRLW